MEPKLRRDTDLVFNLENFKNYLEKHKQETQLPPYVSTKKKYFIQMKRFVRRANKKIIITSIATLLLAGLGAGYFFQSKNRDTTVVMLRPSANADRGSELANNNQNITPTIVQTNTTTPTVSGIMSQNTPTISPTATEQPVVPTSQQTASQGTTKTKTQPTQNNAPVYTPVNTPKQIQPTPTQTLDPTITPTATPVPVTPTPDPVTPTPTQTPTDSPTPTTLHTRG